MRVDRLRSKGIKTGDEAFVDYPLSSSHRRTSLYLLPGRWVPGSSRLTSGCRKTFTRSDAMNKHLRSLHGIVTEAPNKKKPTRSPGLALRVLPLKDWSTTTDVELMEDTDLMDVLPRIRTRQKFWTVTGDDLHRVERLRERHPRGGEEESDESFDEGMGMRYPMDPVVQGIGIDEGGEMNVGSRTRSQVRFIVAKAKLMLVDEENAMRRRELKELMDQERRQEMGEGGKVSAKE